MMKKLRITIGKKTYDVTVEDLSADAPQAASPRPTSTASSGGGAAATPSQPAAASSAPKPQLPVESGAVTSPMAGSVKSVLVKQGDEVREGQPVVILEAMKMENQITAPAAGTVISIDVAEGESVTEGHVLLVLE